MTDERREENQPEPEDVEAHSPPTPLPEAHRNDEGEDVEAHSPPTPLPPLQEPPVI